MESEDSSSEANENVSSQSTLSSEEDTPERNDIAPAKIPCPTRPAIGNPLSVISGHAPTTTTIGANVHTRAAMLASRMHSRRKKLLRLKRGMQRIQTQALRKHGDLSPSSSSNRLSSARSPLRSPRSPCSSSPFRRRRHSLSAGGPRPLSAATLPPSGHAHGHGRLRTPLDGIGIVPSDESPRVEEVKLVSILKSPKSPGLRLEISRERRSRSRTRPKKEIKHVRFNEFVAIATPMSPPGSDDEGGDDQKDVPVIVRKMASLAARVRLKLPGLRSSRNRSVPKSPKSPKSPEPPSSPRSPKSPVAPRFPRSPPMSPVVVQGQSQSRSNPSTLAVRRKRSRSLPFLPRVAELLRDNIAQEQGKGRDSGETQDGGRGGSCSTPHSLTTTTDLSSPGMSRLSQPGTEEVMFRKCVSMYRCLSRVSRCLFRTQSLCCLYALLMFSQSILVITDLSLGSSTKRTTFSSLLTFGNLSWAAFFVFFITLFYLMRYSCLVRLIPKLLRARQVRRSLENYLHYSAMVGREHSLTLDDGKPPCWEEFERFTERNRRLNLEERLRDVGLSPRSRSRWRRERWRDRHYQRKQWISSGGTVSAAQPYVVRRFSASPTMTIPPDSPFSRSIACPPGDDGRILSPLEPRFSGASGEERPRFGQFQFPPSPSDIDFDDDVVVVEPIDACDLDSVLVEGLSPREMDREAMLEELPERRTSTAESFLRVQRSDSLASAEFVKKKIRSLSVGHSGVDESDEDDLLPTLPAVPPVLSSSSTSPDILTAVTSVLDCPPPSGEYEQSPFVRMNRPFLRLLVDKNVAARVRVAECVHKSSKALLDHFSITEREPAPPLGDLNDVDDDSDGFPSLVGEPLPSPRSPSPLRNVDFLPSPSGSPSRMKTIMPMKAFRAIARSELVIAPLQERGPFCSTCMRLLILVPQLFLCFLYLLGHLWFIISVVGTFTLSCRAEPLIYVQNLLFLIVVSLVSFVHVVFLVRKYLQFVRRGARQESLEIA